MKHYCNNFYFLGWEINSLIFIYKVKLNIMITKQKDFIRKLIREELNNWNKSKTKPIKIFFRKTKSPKNDLKRNFSCFVDAWFKEYDDAYKYYKEQSQFSQEPKQDIVTGMWCGDVEDGLSSYIVENEEDFKVALYELKLIPHLQNINKISVFSSNEYYLEGGSDGEDLFLNGKYLFDINEDITYQEYLNKLNP